MSAAAAERSRDMPALPEGLCLRPVNDADLPFLAEVYASTRTEELAQTDWSEAQKTAFLDFQFRAQHQHYTTHYHGAEFLVIEQASHPVGRLTLHWRTDELRIVDIALLPAARGQGIGGVLLRSLLNAAAAEGCSVSIHVEQMSPAMNFYRRLGFRKVDEHGIYHRMAWRSDEA